jgi:5-hydroxyisourate hydrolase
MSQITTHILDISEGQPAQNVPIRLSVWEEGIWREIGAGLTNGDGRVADLCPAGATMPAGTYQMHFDTGSYFVAAGKEVFYPWADVIFNIGADGQHYHIPLLLSPFGHSTYRGS